MKELHRVEYLLRTLKSYNMYETPQLQKITIADFMDKFLSVVREDFKMKGIRIEAAIGENADFFYADPRALQQILLNFLTNSADALEGRDNQTIALQCVQESGHDPHTRGRQRLRDDTRRTKISLQAVLYYEGQRYGPRSRNCKEDADDDAGDR